MASTLAWIAVLVLVCYGVIVALFAAIQRRLLYRPPADAISTPTPDWTVVQDGGQLLGWWRPGPDTAAPVMVFFHGNRGTLARVAAKTGSWPDRLGVSLLLVTYRGYEGKAGHPSERGLYDDGRAALDWLDRQGLTADRIILYGESLGSGVATQMALERTCRALVLEAAFASIAAVAHHRYPWLAATPLVRDRYDNAAKIGAISCPILLLHGDADATTPSDHSRLLARRQPKARLAILPEAHHLDIHQHGGTDVLAAFLRPEPPHRIGLLAGCLPPAPHR
jgi:hypothetical protein